MRKVRLEVIECEHTGELGFRPKIFSGWESYVAGVQLSHDLIDHSTKEWGEIWQEFKAFGANLFVTEFGNYDENLGFFSKGENQTQKKGYSMGTELESIILDGDFFSSLKVAPKVSLDSEEKSNFEEFWKGYCNAINSRDEDDEDDAKEYFDENGDNILAWIKYGFKCAKNRLGEYNSYEAFCTKKRIDSALTNYWKETSPSEGHEVTINIDVERCSVELTNSTWY